jgi:hypothetical protein
MSIVALIVPANSASTAPPTPADVAEEMVQCFAAAPSMAAWSVQKGNADLLTYINQFIDARKANGTVATLQCAVGGYAPGLVVTSHRALADRAHKPARSRERNVAIDQSDAGTSRRRCGRHHSSRGSRWRRHLCAIAPFFVTLSIYIPIVFALVSVQR